MNKGQTISPKNPWALRQGYSKQQKKAIIV
jgi:hypothetical protein